MKYAVCCFLLAGLALTTLAAPPAARPPGWPRPVPCRIQDDANPELFIMTLGAVETPIAQGTFDPVADAVTLRDGTVRSHYYRDVLGVKFYAPIDKSRFALPPSGLCTWYYYYTRINEDEVRRNADWIAAHLKEYGAQYVQIDDGWQGTGARGSARNWAAINTNRFPAGMAALARHIKSAGLTPGIWLAPHGQNNDDVVKTNPGVFLLKTNGASASETWEGRFLLDPTHPNSAPYLSNLFAKLAGWGFEYFKIDGQPIVVGEYGARKEFMHDPADDAAGMYRRTLDTVRSAIGPDRYLLGCWGIPLEGAGIMNGSRTGGDVVLGWDGFQVALRPTMEFYYLHNIVWYCDPDVLLVRPPLTLDQARVWATLQGLTGQALMSSDRLMDLSEERVELLRRVYPAVDIRPLDLFPSSRNKRIWDLKISQVGRQYDVVGVFNFGTENMRPLLLKWEDLGLPAEQPVHVFDFWNAEYLGAWPAGFVVDPAPTSCRVLTLMPSTERIELISTSRHITQGWVDLLAVSRGERGDRFQGTSRVVANDPYELRFVFPPGTNYVVRRAVARAGLRRLPVDVFNHQGWAAVKFTSPKSRDVRWEIQFAPAGRYHFPPSAPTRPSAERVGLDGVNLRWQEQYYLNAGYQVYLDGRLLGYTPQALFPVRGLDPRSNHVARIKTVAENGTESPQAAELSFDLLAMIPMELPLTRLEPVRSTGRWRGFELEDMPSGRQLSLGGKQYESGLSAFGGSEIVFDLKGLFDSFTALAGVDDASGTNAAAEFMILGDGKELWRSRALQRSDGPQRVEVAISGVQKLTLRVAAAGGAGRRSRSQFDWIEPKAMRQSGP